jgi:hypothetical protein
MKSLLPKFFALLMLGSVACGGGGDDGGGGGSSAYYGTCDYRPQSDHCVDYYCDSQSVCNDPVTNGAQTCVNKDTGIWSTTPCPTGKVGTCAIVTTGDGKLVNCYYKTDPAGAKTNCDIAGGTWAAGS